MCFDPRSGLAALATLAVAGSSFAGVNLVVNGGFETGNFAGWSVPPFVPPPGPNASNFKVEGDGGHTGSHYAQLSSVPLQFMSQFLPNTVAGTNYELEFWLRRPGPFPPGPLSFRVRWEGQTVYNQLLGGAGLLEWTHFSVPLTASSSGSFLEFGQSVFPDEWHIDDISVTQVPAPSAAPLLLLGCLAAARRRCR